jgi:hypothetical protein
MLTQCQTRLWLLSLILMPLQVCSHPWVVDGGRLPPVRRCCEQPEGGAFAPVCAALSKAEQSQALTGLKQQVRL